MLLRQGRVRWREGLLSLFTGRTEFATNYAIVPNYRRGNTIWERRPDLFDEDNTICWSFFSSNIATGLWSPPQGRHFGTINEQMLLQQAPGIAPSRFFLAGENDGEKEPMRSPLSQAPGPLGSEMQRLGLAPRRTAQAVLTGIRQSPKKLNLMAEMIRGMRVEDALTQTAVSVKRAAKIVFKVVHSAQANAVHNFGLEKDRLIVREAFVGKDKYMKRARPHGKGRAGKLVHRRSRLTVILNEMSAEQETALARLRVFRRHGTRMSRPEAKLVPHRLLRTTWSRQNASNVTRKAGVADIGRRFAAAV